MKEIHFFSNQFKHDIPFKWEMIGKAEVLKVFSVTFVQFQPIFVLKQHVRFALEVKSYPDSPTWSYHIVDLKTAHFLFFLHATFSSGHCHSKLQW